MQLAHTWHRAYPHAHIISSWTWKKKEVYWWEEEDQQEESREDGRGLLEGEEGD